MEPISWEVNSSKFTDSYVAGFLDGDGSIVATVDKRPERRRFPYQVRLKVNLTQHERHRDLLHKLRMYLGNIGSLREVKSHHLVELVIQGRMQVKNLLIKLLPHLILKERQAKIMLRAIEIYDGAKVNVRSSLSEKEYQNILALVRQIRNLNSGTGGKKEI